MGSWKSNDHKLNEDYKRKHLPRRMVEDSDDIIKRKHLARRIANIVHQTADPPIPFDN